MPIGRLVLLVVASWLLAACIHEGATTGEPESQPEAVSDGVSVMAELVIEDLAIGGGPEIKDGDVLLVHYVGTFPDGAVFDSSRERGETFRFRFGAGDVIRGWDIGMKGMHLGGKRRLSIPPQFAYGERGVAGAIPPNATLVFEIEILGVNP